MTLSRLCATVRNVVIYSHRRLENWPLGLLSRGVLLPLKQAKSCTFFQTQSSEVAQRLKRPNTVLSIKGVTTAGVGLIKLCCCFWLNVELQIYCPRLLKCTRKRCALLWVVLQQSSTGVRERWVWTNWVWSSWSLQSGFVWSSCSQAPLETPPSWCLVHTRTKQQLQAGEAWGRGLTLWCPAYHWGGGLLRCVDVSHCVFIILTSCSLLFFWASARRASSSLASRAAWRSASRRAASSSALLRSCSSMEALWSWSCRSEIQRRDR